MSNPAREAAQRAWLGRYSGRDDTFASSLAGGGIAALARNSAAEALVPIRELHRRDTVKVATGNEDCDIHIDQQCPADTDMEVCWECYRFAKDEVDPYFGEDDMGPVRWPCATALLVYDSAELGGVAGD